MSLNLASSSSEDDKTFWREIYPSIGFGVYVVDVGDRLEFVFINSVCSRLYNLDATQPGGRMPLERLPQPLAHQIGQALQQCIATGEVVVVELYLTGQDGTRWFLNHVAPVRDAQGQICRLVGSCCDISDRKRIEQALRDLIIGTTAVTGDDLFPVLVNHLALTLEVDYVILMQRVGTDLQVLASSPVLPMTTAPFLRTFCEKVIEQGDYYQPTGIQESFPEDEDLRSLGAKGYYGVRLSRTTGEVLGHLCILHTRPLAALETYQPILQSFASRVVLELERQRAEVALRESEERYRLVAENMTDLVCLHAANGQFLYISPSSVALLGYEPEELVGKTPYDFCHPEDRDRFHHDIHIQAPQGKATSTVYRFRSKSGSYIWLETLTQPILNIQGQVVKLQTTSRAIAERIHAEEQLRHQALHDELTGLPNRNLLTERLERALHRFAQQPEALYAVLFLDLDRFKVINDSLGHLAGDQLLINVARKLQMLVRDGDVAARLGGDEFVILLEPIDSLHTAFRVAERIRDELQTPQLLGDRQIRINASIGIVFGSYAHQTATDLLRDADIAMYRAKAQGGGCYEVFDPVMHLRAVERLNLENDLRNAIDVGEFILYFQPIVSLTSGRIYGFEALARWQHRQRGLVSPQDFIPIAEETGMIVPLSNWVLEQACQQMATWQREIPAARHLMLSVNLATQQFRQPEFVEQVHHILQTTGLSGESLILEFREGMLINDLPPIIARLEALRSLSIQLSIDDFGTGYSSLNHLHQFPLNMLKIAQTLISAVQPQGVSNPIASMVVALARQLDLVVVAEGIESIGQLQRLAELGCELGQGYCFSPPLAASEVPCLLASTQSYEMRL